MFPNIDLPLVSPILILRADRNRSCQVCFEERPLKSFDTVPHHRCHEDERTICDDCLYSCIERAFQGVFTAEVHCPELSCGTVLPFETIKHVLLCRNNRELFDRYDKFICRNLVEQMEEFSWCSNPNCSMGQLNAGGNGQNIVTCLRCKHKTCFIHKVPWHQNMNCEEYESKTDPIARASLKWITQNTKQCPKCAYRIEKNDGCDHMTCTHCHHEFCWACLADFNSIRQDGNHRHDPSCKHYAAYEKV